MKFSVIGSVVAATLALFLSQAPLRAALPNEPLGPSSRRTGISISEIHFHPAARNDARQLEFVEFYNSNPFQEDLSGWRLEGDIQFTFPAGSILSATSLVVVAAAPADIQAVYGASRVWGPFTGNLPNGSGTLRLVKRSGGIVLDLTYANQTPWPLAPHGLGPSMVLSRPSYGEADPRAWSASVQAGGSPGSFEPESPAVDSVVINEILLRALPGQTRFVELHNLGGVAVDLSAYALECHSTQERYRFPSGTVIQPYGFLSLPWEGLGLNLDVTGDRLALVAADGSHYGDVVELEGQGLGVVLGRQPESSPWLRALRGPTPGAPNQNVRTPSVVINEIYYQPPVDLPDGEFVELYNIQSSAIDISGWRFVSGISYTFPSNTWIPSRGYIVVAKNPDVLRAYQGASAPGLLFGPYQGGLSSKGERLALAAPERVVVGDAFATAWVVEDEVDYETGGRWGQWSDGGGSSLELINPRSDHNAPSSWADSDERGKASWQRIEQTGVLDMPHPSTPTADQVQLILFGKGEALVDDVQLIAFGTNRVRNSQFETNILNWVGQGTHRNISWETNGGFQSARCLRISASDRGDHVANRVRGAVTSAVAVNNTITLGAMVRWERGNPDFLIRVRSGMFEAAGRLKIPSNLGTPGRANSRSRSSAPPSITEVQHFPILPPTNTAIRVTARVSDFDGLAAVTLRYRIDPTNTLFDVVMTDDGQGADAVAGDRLFSAFIPGQRAGKLVAFRVEAVDKSATPQKSVFPELAPLRECLVRVGEPAIKGAFATYRLWLTQSNVNYWTVREKMSNEEVDATFLFGTNRVVYNAGARYAGSYYTVPTYDTPVGNLCGYDVTLPKDQLLLGEDHFTLDWPIRDDTDQREQLMFWFCEQLGLPNMYRRYVNMVVNGVRRGDIYDDVQQPDGTTIREFFRNDADGDLIKTDCWDEFNDTGEAVGGNACVLNTMEELLMQNGEKKTARYRWNWRPRAVKRSAHDFSALYTLIDAVNTPGSNSFVNAMMSVADMDHWMRTFAMNDLASYWDAFGNPNAKNTYLYKPQNSGWKLYSWDFDVGLGVFNDPVDAALFDTLGDPGMNRIYASPTLVRPYWEALQESVNTFFISGAGTAVDAILNSKYEAFKTNGIQRAAPTEIKTWINQRRAFLLTQLKKVSAPFAIATNRLGDFTNREGVVVLTGTAPPLVHSIRLNGAEYPIRWSTATNWAMEIPLQAGTNTLTVQGYDRYGVALTNATPTTVQLYFPSEADPAEGNVVFNEILFQPIRPGSEFVEIYNRSARTPFDLSGWSLEGLGFTFPQGSLLPPGGFLLVVGDLTAFGETYGWDHRVAGAFPGRLDPDGETLRLVRPASASQPAAVVDSVTFGAQAPWPSLPGDIGRSIELIDPSRDRWRVGNWASSHGEIDTSLRRLVSLGSAWRYEDSGNDLGTAWREPSFDDSAWASGPGVFYNTPDVLPFPKTTLVRLTNSVSGAKIITHYFRTEVQIPEGMPSGELRFSLAVDDGAIFYLNGQEMLRRRIANGAVDYKKLANVTIARATLEGAIPVLNTQLKPGTNVLAAELHQSVTNNTDVVFGLDLYLKGLPSNGATPGAANRAQRSLPAFPSLVLSEVQPDNVTGPVDRRGKRAPWVELYNSGNAEVALDGLWLSADPQQLKGWAFPAGVRLAAGAYLLVWLDADPAASLVSELHAGFTLDPTQGMILLSREVEGRGEVLDYLAYQGVRSDESFGRFPSSSVGRPQVFAYATPRAQNDNSARPATLWINEWMASNATALADPADGDFEDWFEIYNPAESDVDISGFSLTDDLAAPAKFRVPQGYRVPAKGFLLVWADEESGQSQVGRSLHVNFKLSGTGESIGIFGPDGRRVDAVVFKAQTNDISQGRYPDGAPAPFRFFRYSTAGAPNQIAEPIPHLEILQVILDAQGVPAIQWKSELGRRYRLMVKEQLTDATWTPLGDVFTATRSPSLIRDPGAVGAVQRFYRLELLP